MEKFFDITCRIGDLRPDAVVLVATVRALKHHAGDPDGGLDAIEIGAQNLARHIGIVNGFGLQAVVAVNRFPDGHRRGARDGAEARARARRVRGGGERGVRARRRGRDGARGGGDRRGRAAVELRVRVPARRADRGEDPAIATKVYGADGVDLLPAATKKAAAFEQAGLGELPICMAKTHLSLSHDPALRNAPTGFTVPVRDLRPYTGAGWIVALCGDMMTMPGLGKSPAAFAIDIDENGETVGLF